MIGVVAKDTFCLEVVPERFGSTGPSRCHFLAPTIPSESIQISEHKIGCAKEENKKRGGRKQLDHEDCSVFMRVQAVDRER
jgi:hypothetical protein